MAVRKLRNYIDGEWRQPEGCEWLDVENPSTGEIIARVPLSSTAETETAIGAAKAAFPAWAATPVSARVALLFRLAEIIRENEEPLSRSVAEEMGKSLP
ncbi:MAG: aldehyde dehydrogenase family protein, partial [Proteobacteria bacterium]|nr:aldehyde dehydrogenase family protein [Pseudomonadota bacterium]